MAATGSGGSLPPNFLLTPQQQNLLFAALNSNKQPDNNANNNGNPSGIAPGAFQAGGLNSNFQSPSIDHLDYSDFGDSTLDFSFNPDDSAIIDNLPNLPRQDSQESESHEKRSHPDDEDDEEVGTGSKRRESLDKAPKKPGRKPLTSEPTSKRKAQNRAAQRAFRERKEQHLKDLETKVEELQKASDDANNENTALRAQVEKMSAELSQYKQKLSLVNTNTSPQSNKYSQLGKYAVNGINDLNFQFDFPKFGALPNANPTTNKAAQPISPQQRSNSQTASPTTRSVTSPVQQLGHGTQSPDSNLNFANGFTPSMSSSVTNASRASLDSASFSINGGATSSPSASSQSNAGPSSSCGTSPEPATQSPMGFKPVDTMTTIGEEQPSMATSNGPFGNFANLDFSDTNLDWLAQQNGGQFDPQLFGDYREPQNNVLANPSFDDFFNDAFETDFFTPYNAPATATNNQQQQQPAAPKTNILDQIDAQKDAVDDVPPKTNISCNQIWDKLQSCSGAQSGDFDLDGLCSELTKKAKCSGSGPVVGESDFDNILKKYMGKDSDKSSSQCATKLGITLDPNSQVPSKQ